MKKFIINQPPNMNIHPLTQERVKELSDYVLSLQELRNLLDTISYQTRMALQEYHQLDIAKDPLTGHCIEATDRVCYSYGNYFDILPYEVQRVFSEHMFHTFAVGRFDTVEGVKRYIIDLTYRQFCLTKEYEEKLGYSFIGPGHFFYDKKLLKQLLKNGYLEVTRDSLVAYGESFSIAGQAFYKSKRKSFTNSKFIHYSYEEYSEVLETGKMITKRK